MAVGKMIDSKGGHIEGFKEELNMLSTDKERFLTFFAQSSNAHEAKVRGYWDFALHIASPLKGILSQPHMMTCLEVGYGGGRIIASAANSFKHAIGVDIHEQTDLVKEELANQGVRNVDLYKTDGESFPIPDHYIDFAYSFIVFQHMELIEIFEKNLKEVFRVLKPNGLAIIYFGRTSRLSLRTSSRVLDFFDSFREVLGLTPSYVELPARVNSTNLLVSLRYVRKFSKGLGFEVIKFGRSFRNVPDEGDLFGGQNYVLLRKKAE